MSVKENKLYENLYRPNYEGMIVASWLIGALCFVLVYWTSGLPVEPMLLMVGLAFVQALRRLPKTHMVAKFHRNLKGKPLSFITHDELFKLVKRFRKKARKDKLAESSGYLWLGYGFEWDQPQAQKLYDLLSRERESVVQKDPKTMGSPFIHAMSDKENKIQWSLDSAGLMTGVFGATGSGKTRLMDLIISQLVRMDQCVIVIDPKGDQDTDANMQRACELAGKPEKFIRVHRSHPSQSARIDMMKNFTSGAELASRIVALMPSSGDDSFKNFAHMAVNNAIQGILAAGRRPTFRSIKTHLESDMDGLVINAIAGYARQVKKESEADHDIGRLLEASQKKSAQVKALKQYYWHELQPIKSNSDIEGVLHMVEHDREHLSKIIMNIFPILTSLTTGEMADLLSPDRENFDDKRPVTDVAKIVRNNQAAYIGLDTLSDQMTGQAMGSMLNADLSSYAGSVYNYLPREERKPVNILIDEAAEVTNDQLVQLLNKSRGAGFRVWIFTQSIADFEAKTGSPSKAKQILDNLNNSICMRVVGNETQEYIANSIPPVRIHQIMKTQGTNSAGGSPIEHTGNIGERLIPEEVAPVPQQALGILPNLEFFAKISGGQVVKGRVPILMGDDK